VRYIPFVQAVSTFRRVKVVNSLVELVGSRTPVFGHFDFERSGSTLICLVYRDISGVVLRNPFVKADGFVGILVESLNSNFSGGQEGGGRLI